MQKQLFPNRLNKLLISAHVLHVFVLKTAAGALTWRRQSVPREGAGALTWRRQSVPRWGAGALTWRRQSVPRMGAGSLTWRRQSVPHEGAGRAQRRPPRPPRRPAKGRQLPARAAGPGTGRWPRSDSGPARQCTAQAPYRTASLHTVINASLF